MASSVHQISKEKKDFTTTKTIRTPSARNNLSTETLTGKNLYFVFLKNNEFWYEEEIQAVISEKKDFDYQAEDENVV